MGTEFGGKVPDRTTPHKRTVLQTVC